METNLYERIGGEARVRALVDAFYDRMEALPEAAEILAMHPADLTGSREKLTLFLIGWLGGPPVYVERYGHPRLRARHLPFPIDARARDAWLLCMFEALETEIDDAGVQDQLAASFTRIAEHMRNR